jgi:hypothetical protein
VRELDAVDDVHPVRSVYSVAAGMSIDDADVLGAQVAVTFPDR